MDELKKFSEEVTARVERAFDEIVAEADAKPRQLHEAIRWSLFGGGKRFRPVLLFTVGRTFGADEEKLIRTAAAVEMLHTYSLIHDDLPAMDDDDLRRGRETCHKKFGESTAILAGDALQALAFQTIAEDPNLSDKIRIALLSGMGKAAKDMVAGQQLDLEAEGRTISVEELEEIHRRKTGALIEFSSNAGLMIADNSSAAESQAVAKFGSALGLLFQITDDLLDVTQTTAALGKTAAKDVSAGKATYPAYYGVEKTRELIRQIHAESLAALEGLNRPTDLLHELADFLVDRKS